MTRTKGIRMGILILVLLLSNLGCGTTVKVGPQVGMQAPDIQGTTQEGQTLTLKQFRGKPCIIIFWQTISLPSKRVMTNLQQIQSANHQQFHLLTINLGEAPAQISNFLSAENINLPVLVDHQQQWANLYRVEIMPTIFVLDKQGIIRLVDKGGLDWERLARITRELS